MAMINCPEPECRQRISDKAELCPHCGHPIKQAASGHAAELQPAIAVQIDEHVRQVERMIEANCSPCAYLTEHESGHREAWLTAAQGGNPGAQLLIGLSRWYSTPNSEMPHEATEWLQKAAKRGHPLAPAMLQYVQLAKQVSQYGGTLMSLSELSFYDAAAVGQVRNIAHYCADKITRITFANQAFSDQEFAHLPLFTELQEIDVLLCEGISDQSLVHISRCQRLRSVSFLGCASENISFIGLRQLRRLEDLQLLHLPTILKIRARNNDLAELQKALPEVVIQ